MSTIKKKNAIILLLIEILFVVALIFTIVETFMRQRWDKLLAAVFLIPTSFIPIVIYYKAEQKEIKLPFSIYTSSLIFLIISMYLGTIYEFYVKYQWWDSMLHFISGPILTIIIFSILQTLEKKNIIVSIEKFTVFASTAFFFSVALHTSWELFEFLCDLLFSTRMTNFDMIDTMTDILLNFIASILTIMIIKYMDTRNRAKI